MKLYVDDIREPPDPTWTVVRTVGAAIKAIAYFGEHIKEISLDHDISHLMPNGDLCKCEETFEAVAHYIALKWHKSTRSSARIPLIIIHTSNPIGARSMRLILDHHMEIVIRPLDK